MTTLNHKYKVLLSVTSIVYLYFYLVFPLFHYHNQTENNSIENKKFHSHLNNGLHEHHDEQHEDHHSVDDFAKHQHHFAKFNSIELNNVKRIINFSFPHLIVEYKTGNGNHHYSNYIIKLLPENNLRREKCVQSAANVSPPLV